MDGRGDESIVGVARRGIVPDAAADEPLDAPGLDAPSTDSRPEAGRRRGRRRPTPQQRVAVLALAALAAIFCGVAASHPTGIGWLDVVYRGAYGVTLTLAASRVRRWSLVVGAALAAAGALGAALLLGVAALGLSIFLVGRNRRDRVYGAAVGALVAVATLHLTVSWFLGSSLVVGFVAATVILASGYSNTSRRIRRWWRVGLIAAAVFCIAELVIVGAVTLTSVSSLRDGLDATREGVDAAAAAHSPLAALRFGAAATSLGKVADRTDRWWVSLGRAVPVLGQNLAVVQGASKSGAELSRVAARVADEVDYSKIQRPDGGIDVDVLSSFRQPVLDAAETLDRSDRTVRGLGSVWNLAPLSSRLHDLSRKVHSYRNQAVLAALAVDRAPSMLGIDAPRHYLILLGNPAEARDIGGHLGNWAELTIDQGHLSLTAVGQPAALSLAGQTQALPDASSYPASLTEMKPLDFPQNWGADPDMSIVARLSAELFQAKTGTAIDGVVYADPEAFADFLRLTGPVPIPGLPQTMTSENAVKFLTQDQFAAYPTQSAGDSALESLVRNVFDKLTSVRLPGPRTLGDIFRPAVLQGRLKIASLHPDDDLLLSRIGVDGRVAIPSRGDVLGIVNRNANPSKIDAYLHRSSTVSVRWNPSTGSVSERVDVTLRNDAPASGLPQVVIGNDAGLPQGTNLTDLALLSTYELNRVQLNGAPVGSRPLYDGRYWRYTVRVALPPGGSSTVRFDLSGSLTPSRTYDVFAIGQPLIAEGPIDLHLTAVGRRPISGPDITVRGTSATVRLHDGVDSAVSVDVR